MKPNKKPSPRQFGCVDCGNVTITVVLDGYPVADRVLEGVRFNVQYTNGKAKVTVFKQDADYFKTLNQKKWLREMKDYAEETDTVTCPKCGGDIEIHETGPSVAVRVQTFEEIFKLLNK